jgi:hypothetical protein
MCVNAGFWHGRSKNIRRYRLMKASDSTNSLTALTEVVSEVECFICLELQNQLQEPLVDSKLLRTCGCKFVVHPACWNEWMKDKSDWDCPICRRNSMITMHIIPNPVIAFIEPENDTSPNRGFHYLMAIIIIFCIVMIISIYLTQPKQ